MTRLQDYLQKTILSLVNEYAAPKIKSLSEQYIRSPEGQLFPQAIFRKPQTEQYRAYEDLFTSAVMGATSPPIAGKLPLNVAKIGIREPIQPKGVGGGGIVYSHITKPQNVAKIEKEGFKISPFLSDRAQGRAVYLFNSDFKISPEDVSRYGGSKIEVSLKPDTKILNIQGMNKPAGGWKKYATGLGYDAVNDGAQTAVYNTDKLLPTQPKGVGGDTLYHGTSIENANKIINEGFDLSAKGLKGGSGNEGFGISLSKKPNVAELHAITGGRKSGGGTVIPFTLDKNAKIFGASDVPQEYIKAGHMTAMEAETYAKLHGFDGIDLENLEVSGIIKGGRVGVKESEVLIFNPKVLVTQPTQPKGVGGVNKLLEELLKR